MNLGERANHGVVTQLDRLLPFEVRFTLAFLALTVALAYRLGVAITLPGPSQADFIGIHYLLPLVGLALWAGALALFSKQNPGPVFLVALPCYALVMLAHFNIKLWVPDLNPRLYDETYWQIDQALRPLVDGAVALRRLLSGIIPPDSPFYTHGFIAMFYFGFTVHGLQRVEVFRALIIASLCLQALGALSYLIAPALGPFVYEQGTNAFFTSVQHEMLAGYQAHLAQGTAWVSAHGDTMLLAGLAAMPSLHAGGSFLFVIFAWRHCRQVAVLPTLMFGFICIAAIANRWHYLIDLPAGMLLAWACAALGERIAGVARQPRADLVPPKRLYPLPV